jgi:hypothetical protein
MGTLKLYSLFRNAVQIFAAEDPDTEQKSRVTHAVADKVAVKKFIWRRETKLSS